MKILIPRLIHKCGIPCTNLRSSSSVASRGLRTYLLLGWGKSQGNDYKRWLDYVQDLQVHVQLQIGSLHSAMHTIISVNSPK